MSAIITLTDKNFDHYFDQSQILIINFWAPWCEPCHDFKGIFEEVSEKKMGAEKFCFGSIDVDQEKKLAQDFTIQSVPTLAIIRNQILVFIQSGVMPKSALIDLLNQTMQLNLSNSE